MTKCYQTAFHFSPVKRRQVEADFAGGDISSDAGVVLLSQVDRKLGLCRRGEFWGSSGSSGDTILNWKFWGDNEPPTVQRIQ